MNIPGLPNIPLSEIFKLVIAAGSLIIALIGVMPEGTSSDISGSSSESTTTTQTPQ